MYRHLPHYHEGQELAVKCVWCVLMLAAEVAHDVFIILYSHLDGTDKGNKTILEYCKQAHRRSVYHELMGEGYLREYFTVSPKEATYFDLKATRTFMEKIIGEKITSKPMRKILGIMKQLVYSRNELCHTKIVSLSLTEFKREIQEMCKNLKMLYQLAGDMTSTVVARQAGQELDVIFSSLLDTALASGGRETVAQGRQRFNDIADKNQLKHDSWKPCDIKNTGGVGKSKNQPVAKWFLTNQAEEDWTSPVPEGEVGNNQEHKPNMCEQECRTPISEEEQSLNTEGMEQDPEFLDEPQRRSEPESTSELRTLVLSNTTLNSTEEKSTQVNWDEEPEHSKMFYRIKNKNNSKSKNKNKTQHDYHKSSQSVQGKYNSSAPHTKTNNNHSPTPSSSSSSSSSSSPNNDVDADADMREGSTPTIHLHQHLQFILNLPDVTIHPQFDLIPSEFVFARSSFFRIGRASNALDRNEESGLRYIQMMIGLIWVVLFIGMRFPAALLYILSKVVCDYVEDIILNILDQRVINLITQRNTWVERKPVKPHIIHSHFSYRHQCSRGHTHSFLNNEKRGSVKRSYCQR